MTREKSRMPLSRDFPKCFATENERSFCQDPIMQICSIFCVTKSQLSYISLSGERCVSEQRTRAHPFSPPPSFLFLLSSWSSSDPSLHFFMARGGGGRGGDAWRVFFHTRKGRTTWNSPNQSSPGARAHTHTHTHTPTALVWAEGEKCCYKMPLQMARFTCQGDDFVRNHNFFLDGFNLSQAG